MAKAYSSFVSSELFTMVGPVRVRDSYREEGWYIFIFVCSTFLKGEKGSVKFWKFSLKYEGLNNLFFLLGPNKYEILPLLFSVSSMRTCPTQVKSFVLTKELKRRIYFGNLGVINLW